MTPGFWILLSYFMGTLPTAYLIARLVRGIDIRTVGSGNVGATNVFRAVGMGAGFATLAVDMAKGFFPAWGALHFFGGDLWPFLSGAAAVAGHTWSPWMGFRGGKGVATSAGVFLALLPGPMAVALTVFALGFLISRRVSVGSILAAAALPLAAGFMQADRPSLILAVALAALVLVKHVPNMRRLAAGSEPAVNFRRRVKSE